MKKLITLLALFLMVSCGGGDQTDSSGLVIANLSPTYVPIMTAAGSVTKSFTVDVSGLNGDATGYFVALDYQNNVVQTLSADISNPNHYTSALLTLIVDVVSASFTPKTIGAYQIYLTDSSGRTSNKLYGTWIAN